jgi:hypothetical protein
MKWFIFNKHLPYIYNGRIVEFETADEAQEFITVMGLSSFWRPKEMIYYYGGGSVNYSQIKEEVIRDAKL